MKISSLLFQRIFPFCCLISKPANDCTFWNSSRERGCGVPYQQLLHFYVIVIRPVLEYCTPFWHYAITRSQAEQLERLFTSLFVLCTYVMPYRKRALILAGLKMATRHPVSFRHL